MLRWEATFHSNFSFQDFDTQVWSLVTQLEVPFNSCPKVCWRSLLQKKRVQTSAHSFVAAFDPGFCLFRVEVPI